MPGPLTWFRRSPISSPFSGCHLRRMLLRRLRSSFRIAPPPASASDSTGLSCCLEAQRNRLAPLAQLPDREAHAPFAGRGVNRGIAAPGHGIASVLLRCCSGVASLLIPWVSLGYPLGIPWVSLG